MGCAMQEQQSQQQQQQPTLKVIISKDVQQTSDYQTMCSRHQHAKGITANVNNTNSNISNVNKFSQLKESHSALVKILESAPIQQQQQQSQTQPGSVVTSEQLKNQVNSVTIDESSVSVCKNGNAHLSPQRQPLCNDINNDQQPAIIGDGHHHSSSTSHANYHLMVNQHHIHHHHHHRKRNKTHIIDELCDSLDKSSEDDDDMGGSSNSSSASSVTSEVETVFPWKKTRIAREWRQQHKLQATVTATATEKKLIDYVQIMATSDDGSSSNTTTTENNTNNHLSNISNNQEEMHVEDDGDYDDDDDDDELDNSSCECHHHHHHHQHNCRRISSDSSDSLQNDSGCDSDCPENISELCKKFDENFIKQDVNMLMPNTYIFIHKIFSHKNIRSISIYYIGQIFII